MNLTFSTANQCFRAARAKRVEAAEAPAPVIQANESNWDYNRCQGLKQDGYQCDYGVAPGRRKYCNVHGK